MKIIFPNANGGICVIHLSGELPVEQVARKDVSFGVPYLFVDDEDFPSDRTFRDAWEADFSNPDGFGIGTQRWFIEQAEQKIAAVEGLPATQDPSSLKFRSDEINRLRALIQQMKDEVFALEGVQL